MASLKWLVHSVCATAFGYSGEDLKMQNGQSLRYLDGSNSKRLKEEGHGNEGIGSVVQQQGQTCRGKCATEFQMPLHYPRYKKADYENMEEWRVDMLLNEYGLSYEGTLDEKRSFAMGAFLWPDQM